MRKVWIACAIAGLIGTSAAAGAYAATDLRKQIEVSYKDIKLSVDGSLVSTPDEPFIYVEKGRTFIPARPLAEALGAKVGWDGNTNTVQVYSQKYATHTKQDDGSILWTMPAAGFSIKAPPGMIRVDLALALMQLTVPDTVTGIGSDVVAVQSMDNDGAAPADRLNSLVYALSQSLLPGGKYGAVTQENGNYVIRGTALYLGSDNVNVTLRLVRTPKTDWALIGIVPGAAATQDQPMIDKVMDSFALAE